MRLLFEEKRLQILAKRILRFLGHRNKAVEINLVSSSVMRSLNRRFRGKDSASGVLSFRIPELFPQSPKSPILLGEIYLNPTYIHRRGEDIDRFLVHGLLHLLGFGHEQYGDRIKMERLERKISRWLKIKF